MLNAFCKGFHCIDTSHLLEKKRFRRRGKNDSEGAGGNGCMVSIRGAEFHIFFFFTTFHKIFSHLHKSSNSLQCIKEPSRRNFEQNPKVEQSSSQKDCFIYILFLMKKKVQRVLKKYSCFFLCLLWL